MKYDAEIDDELLQNILYRTETFNQSAADSDDADELLAIMIEKGQLEGHDRELFFRCLDTNPTMRRAVGFYVQQPDAAMADIVATESCQRASVPSRLRQWIATRLENLRKLNVGQLWAGETSPYSGRQFSFMPRAALACATLLFVATVGIVWFAQHPGGNMPLVAMRGGPNLIDFGYDADEIGAKGDNVQPNLDLQPMLDTVRDSHERDQLKNGYHLLQQNRLAQAGKVFQEIVGAYPQSYYAHLGQGFAYYMEGPGQLEKAELEFNEALKVLEQQQVNTETDPRTLAVRINRAITLTKLKRGEAALADWQIVEKLAGTHLPKEQQDAIEGWKTRAKEQLEK